MGEWVSTETFEGEMREFNPMADGKRLIANSCLVRLKVKKPKTSWAYHIQVFRCSETEVQIWFFT